MTRISVIFFPDKIAAVSSRCPSQRYNLSEILYFRLLSLRICFNLFCETGTGFIIIVLLYLLRIFLSRSRRDKEYVISNWELGTT